MCESLESRLVLTSGLIFLDPANGVLTINGTPAADVVQVTEFQGEVSVTLGAAAPCKFPTTQVTKLQFFGGAGDDIFVNSTAIWSVLKGDAGNDQLTGGSGIDWLEGGSDNDVLYGGVGNDVLKGETGTDQLFGDDGNDNLDGGDGNDYLDGGSGGDVLLGGQNILVSSHESDVLHGGSENDFLYGGIGNDTIYGDAGNDEISGENGNDTIFGGTGNDKLFGNPGDDFLWGDEGIDEVRGETGADTLHGGDGNDKIWGGTEADLLFGELGDDQLFGEDGNDEAWGGAGVDLIYGGNDNDTLVGGADNDEIHGELGDDLLMGEAGNDIAYGELGNDLLLGGQGTDTLYGAEGKDILVGGDHTDFLNGMDGEDILIGGSTLFGDDSATIQLANWNLIRSAWGNGSLSYASRISAMSSPANPQALIPGSSVRDDFVSDQLVGAADLDWYFLVGGNGVQTPTSVPYATMSTLDSYDAQLNETIHTNAVNNVFYPSLVTNGTGDNALVIRSLLYFLNVVTLPAGDIRVNMTGATFPIEIASGKTLQGQPSGSTNLRFYADPSLHNARALRMHSNTVLQDLNLSQIGYGNTNGTSIIVYAESVQDISVRKTKIFGPSITGQLSVITPSNPFYVRDSSNVLIEDSEFAGAQDHFGAEFLNVSNSVVQRSKFHTNGFDGLKVQGQVSTPLNFEVRESQFYNNGRTVPDCIDAIPMPPVKQCKLDGNGNGMDIYGHGIVVRDSVAYSNYGAGFQVKSLNPFSASDIAFLNVESRNQKSVGGKGQHGFAIWHGDFPGQNHDIQFTDSYAHDNDGSGFWVGLHAQSVTVANSIANNNKEFGLQVFANPTDVIRSQFSGTGNLQGLVSSPTFSLADLNHDSHVDGADVSIVFSNWNRSGTGDANGDGIVDGADVGIVFGRWTGDSAPQNRTTASGAGKNSRTVNQQ